MSTHPAKASAARARYGGQLERQSALGTALSMLAVWSARSAQRKALRELAQDGRLLADIGLDRQQALREAAKPFWR
jgi:uncharacterized protein YjiS (DUF1127 family)